MPNEMEYPVYPETKALWWFSMTFHLSDWEKEEVLLDWNETAEKFVCALLRKAVCGDLHIHILGPAYDWFYVCGPAVEGTTIQSKQRCWAVCHQSPLQPLVCAALSLPPATSSP